MTKDEIVLIWGDDRERDIFFNYLTIYSISIFFFFARRARARLNVSNTMAATDGSSSTQYWIEKILFFFFFSPLHNIQAMKRPYSYPRHRLPMDRFFFFVPFSGGGGGGIVNVRHSVALAESSADGRTVTSLIVSFSIRYTNTRRCASAPFQFSRMNKFDFLHNKKIREKKKYENLFVFFSLNTTATREVDTSRNWRWKPSRASIRFFFFSQCSYRQRSRPRHVTCSFVGSVITEEEKDNFYLISSFTPFRLLLPTNITTTKKERADVPSSSASSASIF